MDNFTPVSAAIGGALIGLSAVLLMAFTGRIAGISGIFAGLIVPGARYLSEALLRRPLLLHFSATLCQHHGCRGATSPS
jgi:uncharacterized membrane protein YedE/YeeE